MKRERILKPRKIINYVEPLEERMQKVDIVLNKIREAAMENEQMRICNALKKQDEESGLTFKMEPVFDNLCHFRKADLIKEMTAKVLQEIREDLDDWMIIY